MKAMSPCLNCPDRSADPNCHNPEICEKWAEYEAKHGEYTQKLKDSKQPHRTFTYQKNIKNKIMGKK